MMKACISPSIATIALAGMAGSVAAAPVGGPVFAGHWRVAGVAVSNTGVGALADNDPSLMGKLLTFSPARLGWDQRPATNDACVNPSFTRLGTPAPADLLPQLKKLGMPRPTAFAIHCTSGTWGPGGSATIFRGAGGVLALPWYDGGLLKLVRQ